MDTYLTNQCSTLGDGFILCTDGPLPIRQVIYPETVKKNGTLPEHYGRYVDVKILAKSVFHDHPQVLTANTCSAALLGAIID